MIVDEIFKLVSRMEPYTANQVLIPQETMSCESNRR